MTVKKMQFEINVNWSKTRGGKLDQKIPDFPYKTLTSGSNLYFFFSFFETWHELFFYIKE